MAAAMVKAEDALWDARGSHDPTVAAVLTQCSRSPAPNNGKRGDKWSGNAPSKSRPPPALTSIPFSTLAMAYVNFTFITPIRLTGVLHPVLGRKTGLTPNHFRFSGFFHMLKYCHIPENSQDFPIFSFSTSKSNDFSLECKYLGSKLTFNTKFKRIYILKATLCRV
jgi:hypothetical protein